MEMEDSTCHDPIYSYLATTLAGALATATMGKFVKQRKTRGRRKRVFFFYLLLFMIFQIKKKNILEASSLQLKGKTSCNIDVQGGLSIAKGRRRGESRGVSWPIWKKK